MPVSGQGQSKILIVGEAPGATEDAENRQFVGDAGKYLEQRCKAHGINLRRDARIVNAINCRPPKNRKPTPLEINHCRPLLYEEIKKRPPHVVLLLGDTAVNSYFGARWRRDIGSVSKWIGWVIPDQLNRCWVIPTYHPSFVLRMQGGVSEQIIDEALGQVVFHLDKDLPDYRNDHDKVTRIYDEPVIGDYLLKIYCERRPFRIAIDFETTGIKPYKREHRIVSCAIATQQGRSIAFPILPRNVSMLQQILADPHIMKIGHNIIFEEMWARQILNTPINGWIHDTMIMAHYQNNAPDICSLKFQTCVNFGVDDYDSHIEHYLKAPDAYSLNQIDKIPLPDLLLYNGLDSLYTYRLYRKQLRGPNYAN